MTRQRARILRRVGRVSLDGLAVGGAIGALVLTITGLWLVLGGDIVLANGAWWIL